MSERTAFALLGLAPIIVGLHYVICPAAWAVPDDDGDAPRDPTGQLIMTPIWKVRLIGLGMIALGVVWASIVLFGKPADDPVLI